MIGQSFSILGMALSKVSLGLLLLRLTVIKWHKVSIWVVMGCLMADSVATLVAFWLQCKPPRAVFDLELRPTSDCSMDITPAAVTLGGKFSSPVVHEHRALIALGSVLLGVGFLLRCHPDRHCVGLEHEEKGENLSFLYHGSRRIVRTSLRYSS
jgi:hypothetical protein